jgi:hypothetical protein
VQVRRRHQVGQCGISGQEGVVHMDSPRLTVDEKGPNYII